MVSAEEDEERAIQALYAATRRRKFEAQKGLALINRDLQWVHEIAERRGVTLADAQNEDFAASEVVSPTLRQAETEPSPGDAPMTDLVEGVLRDASVAMSPKDVADRLAQMGYPQDGTEGVRGALSYLKRRKPLRAVAIGRGQWVIPGGPLDTRQAELEGGSPDSNALVVDAESAPDAAEAPIEMETSA